MNAIKYGRVLPSNVKQSYKENENVDFEIAFEGEKLMLNNIRIEGDVYIRTDGTALTLPAGTDRIGVDHRIGAHSFFSSWTTQFQNSNLGVIENINEYPRLVRMERDGSLSNNDLLNSSYVAELASPDDVLTQKLLECRVPKEVGGTANANLANLAARVDIASAPNNPTTDATADPASFSIKPLISLNKSVGGNNMLDYQQSGGIKLTCTLERALNALHGVDCVADSQYELRNLRLCYMSVPSNGKSSPVRMRTSLNLKNSLLSNQANVASKVPAICDSVSISYMLRSRESSPQFSNVNLEMPPHFSRVDFMFNDSFNKFLAFELDNKVDIVKNGLDSVSVRTPNNNATLNLMSANKSFIAGLRWRSLIDLSNQKFTVNQFTGITNNNPYLMYLYFHSIVQIN